MHIPVGEVLRYMGWRGKVPDGAVLSAVEKALGLVNETAAPRAVYKVFSYTDGKLAEADLMLPGEDIARHLKGADKVVLIAATLGIDVDRTESTLARTSALEALAFDAAASAAIEEFLDEVSDKISADLNRTLGARFSPGYGDLPIECQAPFMKLLRADKEIGLTLNEEYNMIPLKSVTALIPVGAGCPRDKTHDCARCSMSGCAFRSEKK